jgi:hypothetical protein
MDLVGCRKSYCGADRPIICKFLIDFLCVLALGLTEMKILCSLTIGFNICTVVFIYSPSVPPGWSTLFLVPNITVASVMSCRLFRELKLGLFVDPMGEEAMSKIVFRDMATIPRHQSGHAYELRTREDAGMDADGTQARGLGH